MIVSLNEVVSRCVKNIMLSRLDAKISIACHFLSPFLLQKHLGKQSEF